jgi:agmatine/peptidylarginine deiminase
VIDSLQYLALLCWRVDRRTEAEQCCRSSITHLQDLLETIEASYDSNREVSAPARPDRYQEALQRAERNLSLVRPPHQPAASRAQADESSSTVLEWKWQLLNSLPGQILPMDIVPRANRLPGEFERQDALLLSWQHEWARQAVTSIAVAIHEKLPVVLIVNGPAQEKSAERELTAAGVPTERVRFLQTDIDSPWVRDYGPLSVESSFGVPLWVDPVYPFTMSRQRFEDDELPQILAQVLEVSTVALPRVIEGGGILSNGAGICLVSTTLQEHNQRLGIGVDQLTNAIQQYFGASQVVYLDPLIDERSHHVDWFCAFTAADTIVVGQYGNDDPANAELLDRHARRLARLDVPGGKLKVVRIPMPPRGKGYFGGTYTNVIFANGVLVVPTWPEASTETEQQVFNQYGRLLPGWRIVPIPSWRLGVRSGGPRCCSMNLITEPRLPLDNAPSTNAGSSGSTGGS